MKSKLNIELAKAIQEQIRKEPLQFSMSAWFRKRPSAPNCGTTACIAGWARALSTDKTPSQLIPYKFTTFEYGRRKLGITNHQANVLFFRDCWPVKIRVLKQDVGAIKMLDLLIAGKL